MSEILNKIFIRASMRNDIHTMEYLLQDDRVDPSYNDNYAIEWASLKGYVDTAKLLLQDERVNPTVDDDYAIISASENGQTDIVNLLKEWYKKNGKKLPDEV
jgi:ankyrin repeat protein